MGVHEVKDPARKRWKPQPEGVLCDDCKRLFDRAGYLAHLPCPAEKKRG